MTGVQTCALPISKVEGVEEIPTIYNGNLIYELPPTTTNGSSMEGMEQRYDGHCWIKPVTTKINFPATIRRSKCAGHLRCINDHCPYLVVHGERNKKSWTGLYLSSWWSKNYVLFYVVTAFCDAGKLHSGESDT